MKKKIVLFAAAVLLLVLSGCGKQNDITAVQETETTVTETPAVEESTQEPVPAETKEASETDAKTPEKEQPLLVQITKDDPSIAYVLVRMQNSAGLLPLPLDGEYTRAIRQMMADGSEAVNVLHLTPNGFWMEEANCEGHDCIEEGEVTLENREERVLWNMIICLPHQLTTELITREEAEQMLGK